MSEKVGGPVVNAAVKIIPAKRSARYDVPLGERGKMTVAVNAKTITFGASSDIPKTLDAIIALAHAVRDELVAQGVES